MTLIRRVSGRRIERWPRMGDLHGATWKPLLKQRGHRVSGTHQRPATPRERATAAFWAGANTPEVPAESLDWLYTADYGAHRLDELMSGGRWQEWWDDEVHYGDEDGREGYYSLLEAAHLRGETDPVILIEDADGSPEGIWDGWHRTAISILNSAVLPALVGRRRR